MTIETDSDGVVSFRGFAGDYELVVPDYETVKFHIFESDQKTLIISLQSTSAPTLQLLLSAVAVAIFIITLFLWKHQRSSKRIIDDHGLA